MSRRLLVDRYLFSHSKGDPTPIRLRAFVEIEAETVGEFPAGRAGGDGGPPATFGQFLTGRPFRAAAELDDLALGGCHAASPACHPPSGCIRGRSRPRIGIVTGGPDISDGVADRSLFLDHIPVRENDIRQPGRLGQCEAARFQEGLSTANAVGSVWNLVTAFFGNRVVDGEEVAAGYGVEHGYDPRMIRMPSCHGDALLQLNSLRI
jgi:hypothetical protein